MPFSDDFDRANESPLGSPYFSQSTWPTFDLTSNHLLPSAADAHADIDVGIMDTVITVEFNAGNTVDTRGIIAGFRGSDKRHILFYKQGTTYWVYVLTDTVVTDVVAVGTGVGVGSGTEILKVEAVGNTYSYYGGAAGTTLIWSGDLSAYYDRTSTIFGFRCSAATTSVEQVTYVGPIVKVVTDTITATDTPDLVFTSNLVDVTDTITFDDTPVRNTGFTTTYTLTHRATTTGNTSGSTYTPSPAITPSAGALIFFAVVAPGTHTGTPVTLSSIAGLTSTTTWTTQRCTTADPPPWVLFYGIGKGVGGVDLAFTFNTTTTAVTVDTWDLTVDLAAGEVLEYSPSYTAAVTEGITDTTGFQDIPSPALTSPRGVGIRMCVAGADDAYLTIPYVFVEEQVSGGDPSIAVAEDSQLVGSFTMPAITAADPGPAFNIDYPTANPATTPHRVSWASISAIIDPGVVRGALAPTDTITFTDTVLVSGKRHVATDTIQTTTTVTVDKYVNGVWQWPYNPPYEAIPPLVLPAQANPRTDALDPHDV